MTNERFARLMAGLLAGDRSALREVYEAWLYRSAMKKLRNTV